MTCYRVSAQTRVSAVSSKIYIDLTDVVSYAARHGTCDGIRRVQLEIATAFVRSNPNAVPFSLFGNVWRELRALVDEVDHDIDRFLLRLKEFLPGTDSHLSWRNQTSRLLEAQFRRFREKWCSRVPKLNAGDTLFVAGGVSSINKAVIKLCRHAARKRVHLIVVVHDVIPFTNPEYVGYDFTKAYRLMLSLPAHFIVATDFNRKELEIVRRQIGQYGKAGISVIPWADEFPGARRNEKPLQLSSRPSTRLLALTEQKFILCVGTVEVRKNHAMLLAVWDELAAELGERLPPLVIAGRRGWKAKQVLRRLDARVDHERVIFVEAPNDRELRWLYSACLFTVFPSFFEGWGLPVGESLWFGKACAASDTSSTPFVGRDLCVYFSPYHSTTLKDAIRCLLDPHFRSSREAKIANARLRTWSDVVADIEALVMRGNLWATKNSAVVS